MGERFELATASPSPRPPIYVTTIDPHEDITDPFASMQDGIFAIEKDSPPLLPFPLAVSIHSIRKWESIQIIVRQSPAQLGKARESSWPNKVLAESPKEAVATMGRMSSHLKANQNHPIMMLWKNKSNKQWWFLKSWKEREERDEMDIWW